MRTSDTWPVLDATFQFSLGPSPKALQVDEAALALTGFSHHAYLAEEVALRDRIHTDDADIAARLFAPDNAPLSGVTNLRVRQANGRIRCVKALYAKSIHGDQVRLDLTLQDAKSLPRTLPDPATAMNFRAMMENTNDFIYFKDRNHVFTGASQTLVSLCEDTAHWTDLLGQTDYDVFPEPYADIYYRLEKQVFNGVAIAQEIQAYQTREGKQGWVDNRKYPILDDHGQIMGLFGIARDITQQHRLEVALLSIANFVSKDHGENCFNALVAFAAQQFDAEYVHIALIEPDHRSVRVVAGHLDGNALEPGHVYALAGTPCEHVLQQAHKCFGAHVQALFPLDHDLAELHAEGYIGEPILDTHGRVQGLIVLVSRRPLTDSEDIVAGLRILAARAGADLAQRQGERTLRTAHERLQLILDYAPIGIWLQDGHGKILTVNKAFCGAVGIAESDFLSVPHYIELIPEAFRPQCLDSDAKALASDDTSVTHQRLPFVDGQIHDLRIIKAVKRDDQGQPVALVGLSLDITEELRQAQLLRQRHDHIQNILGTVEAIIVALDPDGRISLINRKGCQVLGYEEQELIGQNWFETCLPAGIDLDQVRRVFKQALSGDLSGTEYFENPVRTRDGGERLIAWHNSTIRDHDGRIIGGLSAGEDITQRREAERAVSEMTVLLRTVIDEMPDILVVKDYEGRFVLTNRTLANLYGTRPEAMVGKEDADFGVPEDMAQGYRDSVRAIMDKGETEIVFEDSRDARTGAIRHFKSIKKPFKNMAGDDQILVIAHDITDIVQAQEKVAENEKLLQEVLAIIHEGIWDWHVPTQRVRHNAQWYAALGMAPGDVPETLDAFQGVVHPDDQGRVQQKLAALLSKDTDGYHSEHRLVRADGSVIWVQDRGRVVERDSTGMAVRIVGSFSDISYQKKHQEQLEHIAHYDALTHLPNRVLLADRLRQAMLQATRRGEQLGLVYLDLDGFKSINDTHGHDTGDRLLVTLADRMKHALREADTLARLGGDEFVAVLVGLGSSEHALPLLQRLLAAVAQPVPDASGMLQVSASLGVSFYPQAEAIDADQLIRQADQAMYQAKLAGKNRYRVFDSAHDLNMRYHHESTERIREALARGEFLLHYQPKVNMRLGRVIGAEALIRWQHPERGLLLPAAFLPVIEKHDLMITLGDWVIETALDQIGTWRRAGVNLPVSVNVDAMQLEQTDFIHKLTAALARHPDIQPDDLELEVLETSALQDMAGISEILRASRTMGVRLALDDFGTGYSSLTYLKRLAVDCIKIDRSFVLDMLDDPDDLAILAGIISLSIAFKRSVIAEGVETQGHGDKLLQMGCELAQGYAIARPMPPGEITEWMRHWQPYASWLTPTPHDPWGL